MNKTIGMIILFLLTACSSSTEKISDANNGSNQIQHITANIINDCDALSSINVSPNANCTNTDNCNVYVHLKYNGNTRANCQVRYELSTYCGESTKTNVQRYYARHDVYGKKEHVQNVFVRCY